MTANEREILVARGLLERDAEIDGATASEVAGAEELLSQLGLTAEPVTPSAAARARLLEATHAETRFAGVLERVQELLDFSEAQARELLGRIADGVEDLVGWVEGDVAGAHYYHFTGGPRVATADCGLVRLEPGVRFPAHRHQGSEISVILAGRAVERGGVMFEPGDVVVRAAGSVHDFEAVGDEPFVFVVVLEDGIEFV